MAAESSFMKSDIHGALSFLDGTGTPVTLALAYDQGNLECGPLADFLNELVKFTRRGKKVSFAHGERFFPTIKFSCLLGNVVGSSAVAPGTPTEFATAKGAYSANLSTLGTGRPITVGVKLTIEGTNFGDAQDEIFQANDCRLKMNFSEGSDGDKVSFEGEVLGTVVVTNGANIVTYNQIA